MYRWNEWKAYSRKKKIVFSIEFVIIISTIPFLLLKGNEIIDGIVIFQGWLFIAKLLYLICILIAVAVIAKKVNEKYSLMNKRKCHLIRWHFLTLLNELFASF